MKLKRGDALEVTWEDACGGSGWREPHEEGVIVVSVGAFVQRNKKGLCMASGLDPDDESLVLAPSWVPQGMIRKIRKLR